MESFGRLGVEDSFFIDQLAASVVGGRDGGLMAKKGALKERLLRIVSLSDYTGRHFAEGARFKLQLRDRQDARRVRGRG